MQNLFSPLEKIYKALYLFAYDITGNYGLALILLSFFTFIVLYPFNKKAQQIQNKEHKVQAILAPQISEIKKQYSGREQYEQLQWLYRRYGYHPLYAIRSALGLLLQIPFLTAAYYMLSGLAEIQGVSWGMIQNLGSPDHLLHGVNVLPFVMTLVTVLYAFVMPGISKKERIQTIAIGVFFLILLYSAPAALLIFWTCNLIWSLLDSLLSEKLAWVGEYVAENELAFHIIFALALTVGLLVPTEIYIKNASQLWFDIKDIGKYFLIDTVKYISILFFLYIAIWVKRLRYIYLSILLGFLLAIFLQSYIIGADYGIFDGHEICWEDYSLYGIINTIIWIGCFIIAAFVFKRLYNNKLIVRLNKHIKSITFGIIIVQCFVLLITLNRNPIQKNIIYEDGKAGALTTKNMYTVSSKDNIIIFLLDAFDAAVFEEFLHDNHEIIASFKDFTYYPDTISSFGFTMYSLPEILTGKYFDPSIEKYPDFLNRAWKDNSFYKKLKDENYSINLYTLGDFVDKNAPIDNLITEKIILNNDMITKFYGLVKFRIVPHYLKKIFYEYDSNLSNSMIQNQSHKIYKFNDRGFYADLKKGLALNKSKNFLQFYHLEGAHYPWVFDENMEPLRQGMKGTVEKAALGRLKIASEFIKQLQYNRLYDNATLVVIADHGFNHMLARRPVFMIKQPNSHNEKIIVNQRPSTVVDLMPLICQRFITKEYFDAETRILSNRNRAFFYEDKDGGFYRYIVGKDASRVESWKNAGKEQQYRGGDRKYRIGDIIDFSLYGNSNRYKGSGWENAPTPYYSVMKEFEANLILDITENDLGTENNIYKVRMKVHPILGVSKLPDKTLTLYVNSIKCGRWKFEGDETSEILATVPYDALSRNPLELRIVIEVPKYKNDDEFVKNNPKFAVEQLILETQNINLLK